MKAFLHSNKTTLTRNHLLVQAKYLLTIIINHYGFDIKQQPNKYISNRLKSFLEPTGRQEYGFVVY